MIKFNSSESTATMDKQVLDKWSAGAITTERAIEEIKFNNKIHGEISEDEFVKTVNGLGYYRKYIGENQYEKVRFDEV